jgi:hypothetical protein
MRVISKYKHIIHTFGFTLLLYACNLDKVEPEYPDLVILPENPEVALRDYCDINNGNLVVTVYNRGLSTADTSTTRVDFVTRPTPFDVILLETISKSTPVLNSEESITLLFKIPSNCFDPDCEFYISVDDLNNVFETDEMNNIVTYSCKE